jgi:two-component system, NtrC family, response regulator HydG
VSLPAIEQALVRSAVRRTKGNISRAASLLGVTRAQAEYRAKKLGL